MKPRRHLSNKLTAIGASTLLSLALTGITCGSFAWFAYTSRAKIEEFNGVTIGIGQLDMGFRLEAELPYAEQFNLVRDESITDEIIYWFNGREMSSDVVNYVLTMTGYATDVMYPVTSHKYSNGDSINLFSDPFPITGVDEEAQKGSYLYLPLVFKYTDLLEEDVLIPDENIYLSQVKLNTPESNTNIHRAIRIHTNDRNGTTHLINPSSSNSGSTAVGGVLDLDGDGFYDSKFIGAEQYECIYGELKEEPIYNAMPESDDTIVYPDQRTTFNAGHRAGVYSLEQYEPEEAEFEGFYDFRNKHKSVTTTNSLTNNLAYLDLSIYVEGWDTNVVDSEIGLPFSMDLKFEVVF